MYSVDKIETALCTEKVQILIAVINQVLNFPRIILSILASGGMTAALLLTCGSNEAAVPLSIFSGLITLLFLALLGYAIFVRPTLKSQIGEEKGKRGRCVFEKTRFFVEFEGAPKRELSYKDIRGQYWLGDYYVLYVDSSSYKTLLCIEINQDSFDNLYMLASALADRRIKLVRVRSAT